MASARAEVAKEAIEARRAADRGRQQRRRGNVTSRDITGHSVTTRDVTGDPSLSPSPLSSPQTPQQTPRPHTHPDVNSRAREADPFPKPEWADPQHWRDLKANRKAKRLPNTATAHAKFLRDIDKLSDDEWPPGRLLEAIVARGWAAAYDPRENSNGRHPQRTDLRQADPLRGSRPDPCLDMLISARAAQDTATDFGNDLSAWTALPAIGTG